MKLKDLKVTDFKENKKYDFIFPIGSTEQHGPFIPFGTDTFIIDYLVSQVEKEFPDLIIIPTLEYSRAQEHMGFYGSLWLAEETLERIMFDICNSIKDRAANIYITSFHANDKYINKFIKKYIFDNINIINLTMLHHNDDKYIEDNLLKGPFDDHAGNSEISNMLILNEGLVKVPGKNYPKYIVENPFSTDNLIEKCPNGIADNHKDWVIDKKIGQEILDIYTKRILINFSKSI